MTENHCFILFHTSQTLVRTWEKNQEQKKDKAFENKT